MSKQGNDVAAASGRRRFSRWQIAVYTFLSLLTVVIVSVLVVLSYPDPVLNTLLKSQLTGMLQEASPGCSIHVGSVHLQTWSNCLRCDSVTLRLNKTGMKCTVGSLSVSGVHWWRVFLAGKFGPEPFTNTIVEANDLCVLLPASRYEIRCGRLRVSVPDSVVTADTLTLQPVVTDRQFFADSPFWKTRFIMALPQCTWSGVCWLEVLAQHHYRVRRVHVSDLHLDILVNKDKPAVVDTGMTSMPNEIVSSIQDSLQCDVMEVANGILKYGEQYSVDATPALITFDSVNALAEGIANHPVNGEAAVIHAQATFMKTGLMKVNMSLPLASHDFSLRYSGSSGLHFEAD